MAVTEWIHPCRPKGKVYDTGDGKVNELRAVFNQRGGNVSSRCFCMMDKPKKERSAARACHFFVGDFAKNYLKPGHRDVYDYYVYKDGQYSKLGGAMLGILGLPTCDSVVRLSEMLGRVGGKDNRLEAGAIFGFCIAGNANVEAINGRAEVALEATHDSTERGDEPLCCSSDASGRRR